MKDEVWTHGYNSCLHVAISALNYLSSHSRPPGGQEAYNAEHLLQIADEIKRTIAHNVKVAGNAPAQRARDEDQEYGDTMRSVAQLLRSDSAGTCLNCGEPIDRLLCGTCREMGCTIPAQRVPDERRAFEKWLPDHLMPSEFSHGFLFQRDEDRYTICFVQDAWDGWMARAALTSSNAPAAQCAPSSHAAQLASISRAVYRIREWAKMEGPYSEIIKEAAIIERRIEQIGLASTAVTSTVPNDIEKTKGGASCWCGISLAGRCAVCGTVAFSATDGGGK